MSAHEDLSKMTIAELGKLFPIMIVAYNKQWPKIFEKEKKLLLNTFDATEIISIEHVGSTAIPGLMAKPTIDILMQISEQSNIGKLVLAFESMGYQLNKHPENPAPHLTFVKGYTQQGFKGQTFHVHIRYLADWDEIRFRNYLRNNHETAKEYEALKLELAKKYKNNREAYTNAKFLFIKKINKLTLE